MAEVFFNSAEIQKKIERLKKFKDIRVLKNILSYLFSMPGNSSQNTDAHLALMPLFNCNTSYFH